MTLKASKVDNLEMIDQTNDATGILIDATLENGFDPTQQCNKINVDLQGTTGISIRHLFHYPRILCWDMFVGLFTLVAGSLAVFAVPGLLGVVVDAMTKGNM